MNLGLETTDRNPLSSGATVHIEAWAGLAPPGAPIFMSTVPWPSSFCVCAQRSLFLPGHPALDAGPLSPGGLVVRSLTSPERPCFPIRSHSEVLGGREFGEALFNPSVARHIETLQCLEGALFQKRGAGGLAEARHVLSPELAQEADSQTHGPTSARRA